MITLFDIICYNGTFIDRIRSIKAVNTNVAFKSTSKGNSMYFDITADLDSFGVISNVKTIITFIKPTADTKLYLDNNVDKLEITGTTISGTGMTNNYVYTTSESDTDTIVLNKWQVLVTEFNGGINFATDFEIDVTANTTIARVVMFDSILSTNEKNYWYNVFNKLDVKRYKMPEHKFFSSSNIDETNLICNWKFENNSNPKLCSKSGTSLTFNSNPITSVEGLYNTDGTSGSYANSSAITGLNFGTGNYSIEAVFKLKTLSAGGTSVFMFTSKYGALVYPMSLYHNNGTMLSANGYTAASGLVTLSTAFIDTKVYHHFILVRTSGTLRAYLDGVEFSTSGLTADYNYTSHSNIYFGCDGNTTNRSNSIIKYYKTYTKALSNTEITSRYNNFAKTIVFSDLFDYNADEISKNIDSYNPLSGTWKIGELVSTDTVLRQLSKNTKYLECITDGVLTIPNNNVYGTLEWMWYKGADANTSMFHVISNTRSTYNTFNGYSIHLTSDEKVALYVVPTGVPVSYFESASSYIANNTWYQMKLTNARTGIKSLYIRGGSFGNIWTLVSTIGGSGSNPITNDTYTTSSYSELELDAGDRITGIKWIEGITI